jgi:hypothetical protein
VHLVASGKVDIEQFMIFSDTTEFIIFDGIVGVSATVWKAVEDMTPLINYLSSNSISAVLPSLLTS